jgi:hypothetical protein
MANTPFPAFGSQLTHTVAIKPAFLSTCSAQANLLPLPLPLLLLLLLRAAGAAVSMQ